MTDTQRAELFRLALYTSQQPPPTPHINGIREWANGGTYGLRGTSGYGEVYGTHLLDRDTAAAMSGSGVSVSIDWASSNQLNLAYVIDSNATGGEHTLTISSMFGTSNGATFTVADPTPSISSISPDTWEAGRMIDFVISGTNFGSSPSISVSGSGIGNATVTNSSNTQISAWVDLTYAEDGTATVAVTSSGYSGSNFIPAPGGATQSQATKQVPVVGVPALSCTSSVVRGGDVTCRVSGVAANRVAGWQFSANDRQVTGPSGTLTWIGTMVVSGTVTVTFNGAASLSESVTVAPRSWHWDVPSPTLDASIPLVTPPLEPSHLGHTKWYWGELSYDVATISGGPNSGFTYFTSPIVPSDLRFTYNINADLSTSTSVFSQHQCGGASGWISWSDLHLQTRRHEYNSGTQSHWAFYRNSMETQNIGAYVESRTARPGADVQAFVNETLNEIRTRELQINTDGAVQPYGVNYSESGTFLGNMNFGPNYANCQ